MTDKMMTKFHNMLHALRVEAKKEGLAVKCKTQQMENGDFRVVFDIVKRASNYSTDSISSNSTSNSSSGEEPVRNRQAGNDSPPCC